MSRPRPRKCDQEIQAFTNQHPQWIYEDPDVLGEKSSRYKGKKFIRMLVWSPPTGVVEPATYKNIVMAMFRTKGKGWFVGSQSGAEEKDFPDPVYFDTLEEAYTHLQLLAAVGE